MNKYTQLAERMVLLANDNEEDKFLTQLYMVLHIANWTCENKHENWVKEIDTLFDIYK